MDARALRIVDKYLLDEEQKRQLDSLLRVRGTQAFRNIWVHTDSAVQEAYEDIVEEDDNP